MTRRSRLAVLVLLIGLGTSARGAVTPARLGVDAPELAMAGPFAVGVASLTFVQPSQPDVLARNSSTGELPRRDRLLPVDLWYPARSRPGASPVIYAGALTGEDGKDVAFTLPGLAVRGASPVAGSFPLVIMAHGYGGTPVAMSWLAENLASKGYVVVGPHFEDPPITEPTKFVGPLSRRPLDIGFVVAEAQQRARSREGVFARADPKRVVLVGYSMGGYGALTVAGATLDPALAAMTHGALRDYVRGASRSMALKASGLAAVVVISPAGRFLGSGAWGADGLGAVSAPTLFIVGDQDKLVGYDPGVKTLYDQAIHAPRYLLTFENAGHSIGMDAAPPAMRHRLWDQDWFEDPVWRKDRVLDVELHFITAFLDLYVKNDSDKAAFLTVPQERSSQGVWPPKQGERYDAYSGGAPPVTVWKGFQRAHAAGLRLTFAPAAP